MQTTNFPRFLGVLLFSLLPLTMPSWTAAASELFVRPAELEPDIAFWRRIYTDVSTSGGLIHDPERLDVVYEELKFSKGLSPRERSRRIDAAKKKYSRILDRLANGATDLSDEEERVQALWPKGTRRARFEQASEELRFQLGQSDRFLEGLRRSGAYRDYIASTFEKMGLPTELAVLPHVESSFNTYAYSKVGAAGMWQFMRPTGRRFLRIDNTVDERLDPYRSTEAAARFLEQNFIVLGSWPLALTAYNHGAAGMRRAQAQTGTSNIVTIVRRYSSRSFGFASRNFYVAFLAALEIDTQPEKFFGDIKRNPVDDSRVVVLPYAVSASRIASALDLEREVLRRLNPSLLPSVWSGTRPVPNGFEFRVPPHVDFTAMLQKIGGGERYVAQATDSQHRVKAGDTVSTIASRYGVSQAQLVAANDLRRPYRIKVGQILDLPGLERTAPAALASLASVPSKPKRPRPDASQTGVVGTENRYVVRRGDTLSRIATKNGMSEEALMELNSIRNRHFVYEGQVLALAASARVAPPAEASVPVENVVLPTPAATVAEAEPQSEREADEQGPTLVPGIQAAATADPSDYSVREDNTVRVQAAETIGHYADWLEVRASQLRKINRMSVATPVIIGRKVKMVFSKVSPDQFEAKRVEYHRQLQEAFFSQFRINGNIEHTIRSGESIWVLAQQRYNIPIWLLRQYNPDLDMGTIRPGTKLIIPTVDPTAVPDSGTPG